MKKLYIMLAVLALVSCKQRVYLTVHEPAPVFIEKDYLKVGVVNRSFAASSSQVIDILENALTLEGNLDREGSTQAVLGMFDELSATQRFVKTTLLDSMTVENGGVDAFPAAIPWQEVDVLCQKADVQLLFVLETFDTDSKINYSTQKVEKVTPLGTIPLLQHTAEVTTIIKTGWRIYDPLNKIIRDEQVLFDQVVLRGTGITPAKALATILNRTQAIKQISHDLGRSYAGRISPQSFRVWRSYFNKGSRNLKMAKRRSEVGDWEGASKLWLEDTKAAKRKVAGRATYNMAIWEEINGDVYKAYEWAKKAYSDYNIKEAMNYANILRNRIDRIERDQALKAQDQ